MIEEKYYTWEYDYLQSAGQEFAEKHEQIARFLNIKERYQKDPFVERLCEAFAFLTGRIHERLDDDFPELTGGLIEHIFPQLLRPFPSCSILKVDLVNKQLTRPVLIARGAEVQGAWAESGSRREAIFRTTTDVEILPIDLTEVNISEDRRLFQLSFKLRPNVKYSALDLDLIRFYIKVSESKHFALLYYLMERVSRVEMFEDEEVSVSLKDAKISIPGLYNRTEELSEILALSNQSNADFIGDQYWGYRLLLEYFNFHQRFFFVEVNGLKAFDPEIEPASFTLNFHFDQGFDDAYQITKEDIVLNTVPIVNLYEGKDIIQPVNVDGLKSEYTVAPYPQYRDTTEIYVVNRVTSTGGSEYIPATSFQRMAGGNGRPAAQDADKIFYTTATKRVTGTLSRISIRFLQHHAVQASSNVDKLSVEALVTNGNYPRLKLGEGAINEVVSGFPTGLKIENIIRPTEVKHGTHRSDYLWAFIAHMSANLRTMAEGDTLKRLLTLYNWSPDLSDNSHVKIQKGIAKVHPPKYKTLYRDVGFMRMLGIDVDVELEQFEFGEGDVYLFGLVLSHFLAEYASFNTHVALKFKDVSGQKTSTKTYTWTPTLGNIALI